MKRTGKIVSFATLTCVALSTALCMTACDGGKNYAAMPYYDSTGTEYNEALFRKNSADNIYCPDPAVLEITDPTHPDYGYVYLYGTNAGMPCYKSKDLTYWEGVSARTLSDNVIASGCFAADTWAPEVIYDYGTYYMFLSGTPSSEASQSGVNGVLYMLSSDSPSGPFEFVDYSAENRAENYTAPDGETEIDCSDVVGRNSYFDMAKYAARVLELGETANRDLYDIYNANGYFSGIDPYPFIDYDAEGNATRYLYYVFRLVGTETRYLAGVECNGDWTPKYETLTLLTRAGYMDVAGETPCNYQLGSYIDEGPAMLKHDGKYYLAYSYGDAAGDYRVGQAVSDSPLGVYRKLDESENGILLSNDSNRFDLSGTGGHTVLEKDGEMFILYHRHRVKGGGSDPYDRIICADKLEWVTVDDINGNKMDVLYANGPTINLQPRFAFCSEYSDIADLASIKTENMEKTSSEVYLNDGLIAMYSQDSVTFNDKYIGETMFTDTATITLSFDDYRTVRAIMIYNSKNIATAYQNIKRLEFDCIDAEGNEITNYIANLQFNWKENRHSTNAEAYKHAAAAIAEFDEIKCKEIRITIEIPQKGWIIEEDGTLSIPEFDYMTFEHQKKVGISEIVVLGK